MSQPGMEVPDNSRMPKWGWGDVKPFISAPDEKRNDLKN
jgi:hypothetical protein